MTASQAAVLAMMIIHNENRQIAELSDVQIMGYLIDAGFEDSKENVAAIRQA
jgi:hypothetical protein